jgi:hypothetical protein
MATTRTAAFLASSNLRKLTVRSGPAGTSLDELMGQVMEGLRDRQQVLTLQVPVGEKLQHPIHGNTSVKQTGDPLSNKARARQPFFRGQN